VKAQGPSGLCDCQALAIKFSDLDDLNRQAADWCNGLAADRPCPENRDVTVREAFAEEAPKLLPLPDSAFPLSEPIAVKIGKTPYVRFDLPTDHRSVAACQKTSQRERARRRASITYTLRIEYATYSTSQINVASASGKPSYLPSTNPSITEMSIQPNWSREFTGSWTAYARAAQRNYSPHSWLGARPPIRIPTCGPSARPPSVS
jgi:hypothetical protein